MTLLQQINMIKYSSDHFLVPTKLKDAWSFRVSGSSCCHVLTLRQRKDGRDPLPVSNQKHIFLKSLSIPSTYSLNLVKRTHLSSGAFAKKVSHFRFCIFQKRNSKRPTSLVGLYHSLCSACQEDLANNSTTITINN